MPDRPDERIDRSDRSDDAFDARIGAWLRSEALTPDERRRVVERTVRRAPGHRVAPAMPLGGVRALWWLVPAAAVVLVGALLVREILRVDAPPRPIHEADPAVASSDTSSTSSDTSPGPSGPAPRAPDEAAPGRRDLLAAANGRSPVIGQVVDDHGLPLASGTVEAISAAGESIGPLGLIDATGQFMLHGTLGAVSTLLLVRSRNDGRRPALVRYRPGPSPLRVALEAAAPIVGQTRDAESDRPLDGVDVAVTASWRGGQLELERTVAIDGTFEVAPIAAAAPEVASLTYVARISRPGYVTQLRQFTDANALERWLGRPVRMQPAGSMTVHARTAAGRAVADAIVHLLPADPARTGGTFLYRAPDGARTDAAGRVRFTRIPQGPLRVRVAHPDSIATVETRIDLGRDATEVPVVLDLGGEIAGVVSDRSGRPIRGALAYAAPSWPGAREQFAPPLESSDTGAASMPTLEGDVAFAFGPIATDETGRFRLRGLPRGRYEVRIYATAPDGSAFVPGVATTQTGGDGLSVRLAKSRVSLRLAVREAETGRDVSAFALVLLGPGGRVVRRPTRAADGWSVAGIDPTTTAVQVLAPGYLPSPLARLAGGPPDRGAPSVRLAEIELDRPASLAGRVIDSHGHPVAGVVLARTVDEFQAIRPDARAVHAAGHARRVVTGLDGHFDLDGLDVRPSTVPGADAFWLRVERPNGTAIRYEVPGLRPGQRLEELTIVVP